MAPINVFFTIGSSPFMSGSRPDPCSFQGFLNLPYTSLEPKNASPNILNFVEALNARL